MVLFDKHVGIVSYKRSKKSITYVIHHANQIYYEEDILKRMDVVGHYRIS